MHAFHSALTVAILFLACQFLVATALATTTTRTLLTLDVDGTLVHGTGQAAADSVHAQAFGHAIATVLNDGKPVTPVATALPRRLYQGSTDGFVAVLNRLNHKLVKLSYWGTKEYDQIYFIDLNYFFDC